MREIAKESPSSPQKRRAIEMDFALQKAARLNWMPRVILCDGVQRNDTAEKRHSKTKVRFLDSAPWSLELYDMDSGDAILVRNKTSPKYVDQFYDPTSASEEYEYTSRKYQRSSLVRKQVLERAQGHCEFCGARGFITLSGSIYLETHHIIPLSESGDDHCSNAIAVCPNDHRKAHFGEDSFSIREKMSSIVEQMNKKTKQTYNI